MWLWNGPDQHISCLDVPSTFGEYPHFLHKKNNITKKCSKCVKTLPPIIREIMQGPIMIWTVRFSDRPHLLLGKNPKMVTKICKYLDLWSSDLDTDRDTVGFGKEYLYNFDWKALNIQPSRGKNTPSPFHTFVLSPIGLCQKWRVSGIREVVVTRRRAAVAIFCKYFAQIYFYV